MLSNNVSRENGSSFAGDGVVFEELGSYLVLRRSLRASEASVASIVVYIAWQLVHFRLRQTWLVFF